MQNKKTLIMAICCHVDLCGAALSFLTAIKGLKAHGYEVVTLIPKPGRIEEKLRSLGVEYHIIPMNLIATMNKPRFKTRLLQRLYELMFYLKHEVISLISIKRFVKNYPHKPDVIYTNTILPTIGMYLARYYRIPHVVHVRELGDDDFHFKYYLGKRFALTILNYNTERVICISKIVQAKWASIFPGKSCVIYNGVKAMTGKQSTRKTDDIIRILFVGRLSREKGVADALRAMESLRDNKVCLDIYGDGVDKEKIAKYIHEHDLENIIRLKGYYEMDTIPRSDYDMAIMCSHNEAFGRVTIEYMLSGLPVIAYNGGATPEIIEDNVSGLLYNTIPEMVSCIKRLELDKELRSTIGRNGRQKILDNFSENQYISKVNSFFDNILREAR